MKLKGLILMTVDIFIWCIGYLMSVWITKHIVFSSSSIQVMLIMLAVHIIVSEVMKIYRYIWRYMNFKLLLKGCLCEAAADIILIGILECMGISAKRVVVVSFCITAVLWSLSRIVYVLIWQATERKERTTKSENAVRKRLMLIGGGEAAELLLEEIRRTHSSDYEPVCVIDDAPDKVGRYLQGIKIVGDTSRIKEASEKYKIDIIIFAVYNIEESKKREILNSCAEVGVPVKMLPHYAEFMENVGKNIPRVRDVSIEDLLGREKNTIDIPQLNSFLSGKRVLVTGGGGSIGGELCKQIASYEPELLIIADVYENGAYDVQQYLIRKGFKRLEVEILSVTDEKQLEALFEKYRPEIVYHAAAHKHVPLMEICRIEAVKNNVFGTRNVVSMADKYKVAKFVLVSTDKAVNPTNVMGATKRCCELIVKAKNEESETDFVSVRFGNVLGSNGSVIPLFKEQLKSGGPITVTDPKCIRYFMTIPEAVELLLTAGSIAQGGETFVLDMGKPVKIYDMAKKMISLCGLVPEKDIKIEFIGMRPGEKMYEELLVDMQNVRKTCSQKVFVENEETVDLSGLKEDLAELEMWADEGDSEKMMTALRRIVPTYNTH